jgi:hypothetical protein
MRLGINNKWGGNMNIRKTRMAALVLAAGLSGAAQAALHDRGGGLIYDDVLNVTWLQDANAALGSSYDSADGLTDGRTTWKNSVDWADNLSYYDSIRNVTYTDWRLPTTTDTGALGCNDTYSGTDCGYNVNTATSEMAHLYYDELGNLSPYETNGNDRSGLQSVNWGLVNTGPFSNLQFNYYWSGTEDATNPTDFAWTFYFGIGYQTTTPKDGNTFAWAVRDGDVAAVPEASTWTMLLAGLGLIGVAARRRRV